MSISIQDLNFLDIVELQYTTANSTTYCYALVTDITSDGGIGLTDIVTTDSTTDDYWRLTQRHLDDGTITILSVSNLRQQYRKLRPEFAL